ncbi:MAG: hypothetical protein M5R36_25920 [Deltaproteobacteria bacterium]|nr:hypothetical protein [Deltaproteobacteria bacterium]
MGTTNINEVRIYHTALPESQVKRRADDLVRLLALGLARSVVQPPLSSREAKWASKRPTKSNGSSDAREGFVMAARTARKKSSERMNAQAIRQFLIEYFQAPRGQRRFETFPDLRGGRAVILQDQDHHTQRS